MLVTLIHLGAAIASLFTTRKSDRVADAAIICDVRRSSASSRVVDLHDFAFHHRYYGSSALA